MFHVYISHIQELWELSLDHMCVHWPWMPLYTYIDKYKFWHTKKMWTAILRISSKMFIVYYACMFRYTFFYLSFVVISSFLSFYYVFFFLWTLLTHICTFILTDNFLMLFALTFKCIWFHLKRLYTKIYRPLTRNGESNLR